MEIRASREGNKMKKLNEVLNEYAQFKKTETGSSQLTLKEVSLVRKAWKEGKFNEVEKKDMPSFKEMVSAFKAFKMKEANTDKITVKEYNSLKEKFEAMKESYNKNPENSEKLTEGKEEKKPVDIMSKVREARVAIYNAKKHLKEGDMAAATADTQTAGAAVDAAGAAVDATQGQVPQNIVDSVSAVKASVDDLATQCGIQPATDLGADPNAAVPAVNGAGDPNATPAPMMEGTDIKEIRDRLAVREAQIKAIKEGKAAVDPTMANPLADIGGQNTASTNRYVDHKNNESTLPEPSVSSLVNGTEKGAIKWPTTKLSVKESESLADKVVDKHLKESSEKMSFADILKSGVLG